MAKIAIISDTHFGFAAGTWREEDCYDGAEEAFSKAKGADIILLPGDIFDSRVPRPEVWGRAMRLLEKPHLQEDKGVRLESLSGKEAVSPTALKGTPIIAIHGTHDRRGKHLLNPVQGLEAGFLVHLHLSSIVLEVKGENVAIHGMGGVPESYAKDVLLDWDPRPVKGAYNIFVLHQSIDPFIYSPLEPPSLKLEDMPEGFDLYVCGHVHYPIKTQVHGKPFLIPGSTVTTQANKAESLNPKGFYIVDTRGPIDFVTIDARKVFYEELEFSGEGREEARRMLQEALEKIASQKLEKKPIVRIRLGGSLAGGLGARDIDAKEIISRYEGLMVSLGERLQEQRAPMVRTLESVEEAGMRMLKEEAAKRGLVAGAEDVFRALLEGDEKEVESLLRRLRKPAASEPAVTLQS